MSAEVATMQPRTLEPECFSFRSSSIIVRRCAGVTVLVAFDW